MDLERPRAAIYARITDDAVRGPQTGAQRPQGGPKRVQGVNIATQVSDGRLTAAELGAQVVEVITDNDITAGDPTVVRPGFERLMEGTLAGDWDVIVAYDQLRLLRLTSDMDRVIAVCAVSQVRLVYTSGVPSDLETPEGRMFARFQAVIGTFEVEKTRARVRRKMEANAAAGVRLSGRAGFGFEADDQRSYRIVEHEALEIKQAAERILAGCNLAEVARELEIRGIPTRSGRPWTPSLVRRVLLAPRTGGKRIHRGTVVGDASWPAILDEVTWARLARVLNDPRRRTANDRSAKLLTGVVRCGKCDQTMNHKTTYGAGKYYCRHCCSRSIHGASLEEFVTALAIDFVDDTALQTGLQLADVDTGIGDTIAELDDVRGRMAELAAEWAAGRCNSDERNAARAVLEARERDLRAELAASSSASILAPWIGRGAALVEAWDELPMLERRGILLAVFRWVRIGPAVQGLGRFDPDRVAFEYS